jgi:hypothetical protein
MKTRLALFILWISLSSCVSYQHITLESEHKVDPKTERYFIEEDGVRINFDFQGENLPVTSFIYNTSDSILFVDLSSSVYSLDGKVVANALNAKVVNFRFFTSSWEYENIDITDSESRGQAVMPASKPVITIPPGMYAEVTNRPFAVYFDRLRAARSHKERVVLPGGTTTMVKKHEMKTDGRILGVHFFLGKKRDFSDAKLIGAEFWESSALTTPYKEIIIPVPLANRYYVKKTSGRGIPALLLGGALIVGLAAAADNGVEAP